MRKYLLLLGAMLLSVSVMAKTMPTVAIVTTGGTIAEQTNPLTGAAQPAVSGSDLIKAVPQLKNIAKIKVINFSNIDSSQMTPKMWLKLSKVVTKLVNNPNIHGVVITHGTDTMAEASYFLDLTIKTKKPIVFTGAMRDTSDISADGSANIYNAVLQAAHHSEPNWGVTVTLNQFINSAYSVQKVESNNLQAFNSGDHGYLGYIAGGKVIELNLRKNILHLPLPKKLPQVPLIITYAGDNGAIIDDAIKNGAKGIVIEGVGAGNVNAAVFTKIETALKDKIPVVVTTRVQRGGAFPIYGDLGGGATLQKAGAILGGDLPGPKARLLLMVALADHEPMPNIRDYFSRKYH